jgi:hypothetical protein
MHQTMMPFTEKYQIGHRSLAAISPVLDVMGIDKACAGEPGKRQPPSRRFNARRMAGGNVGAILIAKDRG